MKAIDLLLKVNPESLELPTKEVKMNRLSELLGEEVLFAIQALPFDKVTEIRESNSTDIDVHMIIEAVQEPSLKSPALLEKFKAVTPVELVKKILLSGEIEELYLKISKMSGYGRDMIEEIKKK